MPPRLPGHTEQSARENTFESGVGAFFFFWMKQKKTGGGGTLGNALGFRGHMGVGSFEK